jgi:transcriptional regulator with XRE-family HTH domain
MTPEKVTPAQLAAIAQRLNLSTQALADYLGVPVHTLTKWQNGTRTPPAVAARLLAVLAIVETLAPDLHAAALLPPPPLPKITREAAQLMQTRAALAELAEPAPVAAKPAPRRRRAPAPVGEVQG